MCNHSWSNIGDCFSPRSCRATGDFRSGSRRCRRCRSGWCWRSWCWSGWFGSWSRDCGGHQWRYNSRGSSWRSGDCCWHRGSFIVVVKQQCNNNGTSLNITASNRGWRGGCLFSRFSLFNMNKIRVARLLVLLLCLSVSLYAAPPFDSDIDAALNSAESTFQAMKKKDYRKIWSLLTEKSKSVIVDDVYKAEGIRGRTELTRQSIASDFSNGGPLSR